MGVSWGRFGPITLSWGPWTAIWPVLETMEIGLPPKIPVWGEPGGGVGEFRGGAHSRKSGPPGNPGFWVLFGAPKSLQKPRKIKLFQVPGKAWFLDGSGSSYSVLDMGKPWFYRPPRGAYISMVLGGMGVYRPGGYLGGPLGAYQNAPPGRYLIIPQFGTD